MHRPRIQTLLTAAIASTLTLVACGGDDGGGATDEATTTEVAAATTTAAPVTASVPPMSMSSTPSTVDPAADSTTTTTTTAGSGAADMPVDLYHLATTVCDQGKGFAGLPAYDPAAAPHTVAVFGRSGPTDQLGRLTRVDLPEWIVEDTFTAPLVACLRESGRTARDIQCEVDTDEGGTATLELYDATLELSVHEATTGEVVADDTLTITSSCPPGYTLFTDLTEWVDELGTEQLAAALGPIVGA